MLGLDSQFFSDPAVVDISKVTMASIVAMADSPIIFTGAVSAFRELQDDFASFLKKVTYSVASKEKDRKSKDKAPPLKRVFDGVAQASLEKCSAACADTFFKDLGASKQLFLEPGPQECFATMDHFTELKSSCSAAWFAAGQNTSQIGAEPNAVGSLRINFSGVRQFACVDNGLWHEFTRRTRAGEQVLPPEGDDREFTQARKTKNRRR